MRVPSIPQLLKKLSHLWICNEYCISYLNSRLDVLSIITVLNLASPYKGVLFASFYVLTTMLQRRYKRLECLTLTKQTVRTTIESLYFKICSFLN